jgi:DNA-binding IclR family transcriptional regulator
MERFEKKVLDYVNNEKIDSPIPLSSIAEWIKLPLEKTFRLVVLMEKKRLLVFDEDNCWIQSKTKIHAETGDQNGQMPE